MSNVTVVAYQISPDTASLDRLLSAIDARRIAVYQLYVKGHEIPGWPYPLFPPSGHSAEALKTGAEPKFIRAKDSR